ncbi:hypothetical protein HDV01_003127 [Terramyces sp. JEL0728]|nr:hypothetical protein HDV01_003127 [Terramyces sp. JEL0728]
MQTPQVILELMYPYAYEPTEIRGSVKVPSGDIILDTFYYNIFADKLLFYFNGNGVTEPPESVFRYIQSAINVNILMFMYRKNGQHPTEARMKQDAISVYEYAKKHFNIPDTLYLYGQSLGGGICLGLAEHLIENKIKISGIILESTFTSMAQTVHDLKKPYVPSIFDYILDYPISSLLYVMDHEYNSKQKLEKMSGFKLLVFGCEKDVLTLVYQSTELYKCYRGPKEICIVDCGHGECCGFESWYNRMVDFIT